MAAQKHREQMEAERKRVLQEARAKEQEKFRQMEERRKALELADQQRREALKKKNQVLLRLLPNRVGWGKDKLHDHTLSLAKMSSKKVYKLFKGTSM